MGIPLRKTRLVLALLAGISAALFLSIAAVQLQNLPTRHGYEMKNGEMLGGDFIAFYVAGKLYRLHPEALYDLEFQRDFRTELLGPARGALKGELPFVYPPLVAATMSVLASLPFWLAFLVAGAVAALSVTLLVYVVTASLGIPLRRHRLLILLVLWGFIPFSLNTILGGQLAWVGMLCLGGVVWGLKTGRPFTAGLAMSLSYYKPPLFLLALVVLAFTEGRRFISGFLLGALVLMTATVLTVGGSGFVEYLDVVSRYTYGQELLEGVELPPGAGAGVHGLLTTLVGDRGLAAPLALMGLFALTATILVRWRRRAGPADAHGQALWLAVVWIASVGLSLQCIRYDLAILFLPLVMLALQHERFPGFARVVLFGSLVGFYFEFIARKVVVVGHTVNLSSFLFLLLLPACLWTLAQQNRSRT